MKAQDYAQNLQSVPESPRRHVVGGSTQRITMTTKSQAQIDADAEQARRDSINGKHPDAVRAEVHTYPDGSQRVGTPPFPEKSPLEDAADGVERVGVRPMNVPPGMAQSGERAPDPATGTTAEQFVGKVQQQLESDDASGKDPHTINPTTSSDKPQLAGTSVISADMLEKSAQIADNPTAEDLEAIAKQIKPEGDFSPEQVEAAVTQVARETKGPIPDLRTASAAKAKGSKK